MCLAVIGKIVEIDDQQAVLDIQGNRMTVITAMVPEAGEGDFVIVHAGFAIAVVSEQDYTENRRLFNELDKYAREAPDKQ